MKLDHDYAKEHPTVGQDTLFEDDSLETIILNETLSDDLGFPSFEESQNQDEMNENDIGKYCFLSPSTVTQTQCGNVRIVREIKFGDFVGF